MINENQEVRYQKNIFGILAGTLVGALAGAVTMLLLAPQSGSETRIQIQKKGIELRDRATEMAEGAMAQVRSSANNLTLDGRKKMKELKKQGQALVVEQLDHVSDAAKAGKKVIKSY